MEQLSLSEMIPKEILQEVQDAFARFTGMASLISDANGVPVTKGTNFTHFCMDLTRQSQKGGQMCRECGRKGALEALRTGKPSVYVCHAGLMDYAAPIMFNNRFIGSFTGGQVRIEDVNEDEIRAKAKEYDIDPEEYIDAAKRTNHLDKETIERSAQFLSDIAGILSKLAFQRYHLLEEKRQIERSTKIRTELLKKYSAGLNDDLQQLTEFLIQVADDGVEKDDVKTRTLSEQMADNMFRHASELGDAIDYMDVENEDFALHENIYDVRWLIARRINEQQAIAEMKGDTILYTVDEDVPKFLAGDPSMVGSIIGKCIENSIRFTQGSDIEVRIHVRKQGYATMLIIEIADYGVGIEPEKLKEIEQYMQNRGKSDYFNDEFETLGFATVGYSVNAMFGTIEIDSKLGEGTTFTITLPQVEG